MFIRLSAVRPHTAQKGTSEEDMGFPAHIVKITCHRQRAGAASFINLRAQERIMGIFGAGGAESVYYTGSQSHKYVEKLILGGRNVFIISPYIDRHYAMFLRENFTGRRMLIISSSMAPEAERILKGGRPMGLLFAAVLLAVSFNWLAVLARFFSLATVLPAAILLAGSLLMFFKHENRIEVRVPHEFVHAKLYVSEKMAAHGSANLTYNGMHRNIEHLEITSDPADVARLKEEFLGIWKRM